MELIKENWNKKDISEFQKYLRSFSRADKIEWTKNIINTKLPVLAILSPNIKQISKEIIKGNYLSFLDLNINEYYENTAINAFIISHIKEFETYKKYLYKIAETADNWATCDTLQFNIKGKEEEYYNLAEELLKSSKPFTRRIGVDILFKYTTPRHLPKIFQLLDSLENENEYYVNMAMAWLVCECFTKEPELTLAYLDHNKLNKFTINKAVQKCRDSFRISNQSKDILLKFKK